MNTLSKRSVSASFKSLTIALNDQIFWLNVTVNDVFCMEVLKARYKACDPKSLKTNHNEKGQTRQKED